MRLSSKGLGKLTLPFSLSESQVIYERKEGGEDELWLKGRIKERTVNWDYRMLLEDSDIVGFIALAHKPQLVFYIARQARFLLIGRILRRIFLTLLVFLRLRSETGAGQTDPSSCSVSSTHPLRSPSPQSSPPEVKP